MKKKRNEDLKKYISELTIVSASCFGVSASVSLCRPAQTRSSVKDGGAYFIYSILLSINKQSFISDISFT